MPDSSDVRIGVCVCMCVFVYICVKCILLPQSSFREDHIYYRKTEWKSTFSEFQLQHITCLFIIQSIYWRESVREILFLIILFTIRRKLLLQTVKALLAS